MLEQIVRLWPKADDSQPEDYWSQLAPFLASDFDELDLVNRINAVDQIANVIELERNIDIDFHDTDGCFQRAVFTKNDGGEYRLQSLKFQCPVCFGTGEDDGEECTMCGGTGWGVD